ncbi:MAG: amidohydrolase family protein [Acidimicrobiales bacterium]|nr:amidohydrolase family protein [Acidimicrobiales bacterium]
MDNKQDVLPQDQSCDILLTGGAVLTMDAEAKIFEPGAVAIKGDRVFAVGEAAQLNHLSAKRVIDCSNSAIIPGFVSAHDHLFQNAARGLGEGVDFRVWLPDFMMPLAASMTRDEVRAAVTMAAVEQARSGTTAVLDHHYAGTDVETTAAVADAVESVGLRGAIGQGMGREQPYPKKEQLAIAAAAIDSRPAGSKVAIWPTPGDIIYNDQDFVVSAVELARSKNVGWHTHCSQYKTDPDVYLAEHGIRPVVWLGEAGLLGPDAHIAHMIFLNDAEVALTGESKTGVAYCPVSHGVFGLGTIRLKDLVNAGASIGLGYDGAVAGFRNDMFEQIKLAVIIQRLETMDPTESGPQQALEFATRGGAEFLGIDAGVLRPGMLADITIISLEGVHMTPRPAPIQAVAFSAMSTDVKVTIVGGEIIFEEGSCTKVDEENVMEEAQGRANDLIKRLNLPVHINPSR